MNIKFLLSLLFIASVNFIFSANLAVMDSINKEPAPFAENLITQSDSIKASYTRQDTTENPTSTYLDEFVLSGQRDFVKVSDNGFHITISNNPVSKLASTIKMVQQLPLIDAVSDKLSVLGKRKTVLYIGSRKVSDQSELQSYSPSDVESVDIITEPGLKYGRDVDAVIIIHPKKKDLGINLSINGDYIYQRGLNSILGNGRIGYTFRNNWVIETFMSGTKYANKGIKRDADFVKDIYSTTTNTSNKYQSKQLSAYLSIFREEDKFSYGLKYYYTREPSSVSTTRGNYLTQFSVNDPENGNLENIVSSRNYKHLINAYYNNSLFPEVSFNFNLNAYLGKKSDFSYSDYEFETVSTVNRSDHDMRYSLIEGKGVIEWSIKKWMIEGGAEYSYTSTKQDFFSSSDIFNSSSFNNQYQNLYAAFLYVNYKATKELKLNAGIRGELTSNKYTSSDINYNFSESNNYWTPNFRITYTQKNVKINFSYSFNIYRPFYFFLTSGYSFLSPTLWQTGNPTLKVDKEHNFDLSVNWKKTFAYISYGQGFNRCDYGLTYDAGREYSIMYPVSVPKMSSWVLMIQQRLDVRNWHPSFVGILLLQDLHFGSNDDSFNKPYVRLQWKNMLKLPFEVYAYANLNWESSGNTNLYYVHNRFRMDLSLSKSLGHFNLNLSLDNLLDTWRLKYTLTSNGVCYIQDNKPYGPILTLSCSYNFSQNKTKRNYQGGYTSSESKRF